MRSPASQPAGRQAGRKLEAKFQWRRTLSLDPAAEQRDVIEAKLTAGPLEPVVKQAESDKGSMLLPLQPR